MPFLEEFAGGLGIGAASGALSGLFNRWNANQTQKDTEHNMSLQAQMNERMFRNRYQWTMEDMQNAGLNPILAAGSGGFSVGGSGPSVGVLPGASIAPPDFTALASSARSLAEARKVPSEIDVNQAKVKELLASAEKAYAESDRASQEVLLTRKKQNLVTAQKRVANEQVNQLKEEVKRTSEDAVLKRIQGEKFEKEKTMLGLEIRKLNYALAQLSKISDVYSGPVGAVITYVNEISKALGLAPIAGALLRKGGR